MFDGVKEASAAQTKRDFIAKMAIVSKEARETKYLLNLLQKSQLVIKNFLYEFHGIDAKSPRESIKEFFLVGAVEEGNYELLINMLDDRNKLSHIYKEEFFEEIHSKLKNYFEVMALVLKIIK